MVKKETNVETKPSSTVIGIFEGECADARITNKNGLDIKDDVWEVLFESDEYKTGIELGHFIGFLGHPEEIDCQDFRNACIVMTEGHIDSKTGKVYGKFNLIDTPVGRIVKTFIDAGVKFGISVRGAGDIIDNSVEADTFIFRGFDLVAFPAYPEAIPEFTAIAASTNLEQQKKYKAVCAAVKKNLADVTSTTALDTMQAMFASQSDEYAAIQDRKDEIEDCDNLDMNGEKLEAMTQLYLEASDANRQLVRENSRLKRTVKAIKADSARRVARLKAITSAQYADMTSDMEGLEADKASLQRQNKRLQASISSERDQNLKYIQRVSASEDSLRKKDSEISSLQTRLDKTVVKASQDGRRASDLGVANKRLESENAKLKASLAEWQDAYANLYASAVGVDLSHISITASATVRDVQQAILGTSQSLVEEGPDIEGFVGDEDGGLITL